MRDERPELKFVGTHSFKKSEVTARYQHPLPESPEFQSARGFVQPLPGRDRRMAIVIVVYLQARHRHQVGSEQTGTSRTRTAAEPCAEVPLVVTWPGRPVPRVHSACRPIPVWSKFVYNVNGTPESKAEAETMIVVHPGELIGDRTLVRTDLRASWRAT